MALSWLKVCTYLVHMAGCLRVTRAGCTAVSQVRFVVSQLLKTLDLQLDCLRTQGCLRSQLHFKKMGLYTRGHTRCTVRTATGYPLHTHRHEETSDHTLKRRPSKAHARQVRCEYSVYIFEYIYAQSVLTGS